MGDNSVESRVKEYAALTRTARERRDAAIREMKAGGASTTSIANAAGITRAGIIKILRKA
jgi:hypothetical protein